MQTHLTGKLGPLSIQLVETSYLDLGDIRGREVLFADGECAVSLTIAGHRALVVDHRLAPGRLARVELWAPIGPIEGGLAAVCIACDAGESRRSDGSWDELERMIGRVALASPA